MHSQLEYFKRNLGKCAVSIDFGGDLVWIWIWISFALARGFGLLFSCFGCCVCGLSTNWLDDNWNWHVTNLHRRLLSSAQPRRLLLRASPQAELVVFWPSFKGVFFIFSYFDFCKVCWLTIEALYFAPINFPTVSLTQVSWPATLLDTTFSIPFDCLTCGLDIYFHTHSARGECVVCACGWLGVAQRRVIENVTFWLLFMRHDEADASLASRPSPVASLPSLEFPISSRRSMAGAWKQQYDVCACVGGHTSQIDRWIVRWMVKVSPPDGSPPPRGEGWDDVRL